MTVRQRDGIHRSDFLRWVRNNPSLDSRRAGLFVTDIDSVFLQYRTPEDRIGERRVLNFMLIEEKRFGAVLRAMQGEVFSILDQFIRQGGNRRLPYAIKVVTARGNHVRCRYWGFHLLRFSHGGPADSESILWDEKPITLPTLEDVLKFARSPLSLRKRSERRHHSTQGQLRFF
jgi:hypothetical protein